MITLEEADRAVRDRIEVVYQAGTDREERGILKTVNSSMLGGHVLYLGDRGTKFTYLRDLTIVTLEVAARDKDSATQFLCDSLRAPTGATHHLVPVGTVVSVMRCRYCGRSDAEIRKAVGLDAR